MAREVSTFLMFEGNAEEAMRLYVSVFPGSEVGQVERYGPGEAGREGSIKRASFTVGGHEMMCIDSPVPHAFDLTPAISFYVECGSAAEVRRLAAALGEGGKDFMPVDNYGFSELFAWVGDRFGITWQLNFH